MSWKDMAMRAYPPAQLPRTAAGRLEFIEYLLNYPVFDEDGNDTGETVPLISEALARKLLEANDDTCPCGRRGEGTTHGGSSCTSSAVVERKLRP